MVEPIVLQTFLNLEYCGAGLLEICGVLEHTLPKICLICKESSLEAVHIFTSRIGRFLAID